MITIPRVGDVFVRWHDSGMGASPFYGRIVAVSASRRSIKVEMQRGGATPGWYRIDRILDGGHFGGSLVRRGYWHGFLGEDDAPPCSCGSTPTRDTETQAWRYSCACTLCPRCGRAFPSGDAEAPDAGSRDVCGLCMAAIDGGVR